MAIIEDDPSGGPAQRRDTTNSRDEARGALDEPMLFCSQEDRWHDAILIGFLTLMLIVSAVGLIGTIIAASPT
jgi:hypothetical protein